MRYTREPRVLQLVQRNAAAAPICLLCGPEFRRDHLPVLFGFVQAMRDDPTQMVANAICAECSAQHPTREAMERAITDYYRAHIISDLRVLPQPHPAAGHA